MSPLACLQGGGTLPDDGDGGGSDLRGHGQQQEVCESGGGDDHPVKKLNELYTGLIYECDGHDSAFAYVASFPCSTFAYAALRVRP